MTTEVEHVGKLPPKYTFILNPYSDYRFTRCPGCGEKMKQRKLPLFIFVDPMRPIVLNRTCRYCPDCDLLLAHQDELEELLATFFAELEPSVIGNDYLVMGTVERSAWREGVQHSKGIANLLEHLHDFKEVHTVRVRPGGWVSADVDPSDLPVQEPAPLDTPWKQRSRSSVRRGKSERGADSSESEQRKRGRRRRR